jgi:hypothetical protein
MEPEYKTINLGKFQIILTIIGLFIPVPIDAYTPSYLINGYGFAYTITLGKHVGLGQIFIVLCVLINLIMK